MQSRKCLWGRLTSQHQNDTGYKSRMEEGISKPRFHLSTSHRITKVSTNECLNLDYRQTKGHLIDFTLLGPRPKPIVPDAGMKNPHRFVADGVLPRKIHRHRSRSHLQTEKQSVPLRHVPIFRRMPIIARSGE